MSHREIKTYLYLYLYIYIAYVASANYTYIINITSDYITIYCVHSCKIPFNINRITIIN
jgi:hypothetical protein